MNGTRYYPNFGSVRTVNFTCDVYANDSLHGVCFPTVILPTLELRSIKENGNFLSAGKGGGGGCRNFREFGNFLLTSLYRSL